MKLIPPPLRSALFVSSFSLSLGLSFGGDSPGSFEKGTTAKESPVSIPEKSRWTFGGGYAPMFNLSANFRNLGGFSAAHSLPPLAAPVFGEYDDGFVRPDISGSASLTSYWGY